MKKIVFIFMITSAACSDDQSAASNDVGVIQPDMADMMLDIDSKDVVTDMVEEIPRKKVGESCRDDIECERGTFCGFAEGSGRCSTLSTCADITLTRETLGCWYIAGAARMTAAECENDNECAEGFSCILRVCNEGAVCETDAECGGEQTCYLETICLDPPTPCSDESDCLDVLYCSTEGKCA